MSMDTAASKMSSLRSVPSEPLVEQSTKPLYSAAYIKYVIFLLMLVNVVNYMDRMALSVLLPLIKSDLQLSDTQLGLLTGAAFAIFYGVFGIPIARWADNGNRRNIIALAMTFWSGATALCGAATGFWSLFVTRIGVGIGEAGGIAPAQSMISDYVPAGRRAGALSIHAAGATLGIVAGLSLGGWLGELIGWRITFVVLAIPGLVMALVVKLTLREPVRGYADGNATVTAALPLKEVLIFLWRCRSYLHLCLALVISNFAVAGLMAWLPSFYARSFNLSMSEIGLYYGIATGVGGTIGLLLGGFVANSLMQRDVRFPIWLGASAITLAAPVFLVALSIDSSVFSFGCVFLAHMIWGLSTAPKLVVIQSVVKPRMRAMASAVVILLSGVIGFSGGPLFVGIASDHFAPVYGDESLRYSLMAITLLLPWAATHIFLASRSMKHDLKSVGVTFKRSIKET